MRPSLIVVDLSTHGLAELLIDIRDRVVANVDVILEVYVTVIEAEQAWITRWASWLLRSLSRCMLRWSCSALNILSWCRLGGVPGSRLEHLLAVPQRFHVVVLHVLSYIVALVVLILSIGLGRHLINLLPLAGCVTIVLSIAEQHGALTSRYATGCRHALRSLASAGSRLTRSLALGLLLLFRVLQDRALTVHEALVELRVLRRGHCRHWHVSIILNRRQRRKVNVLRTDKLLLRHLLRRVQAGRYGRVASAVIALEHHVR